MVAKGLFLNYFLLKLIRTLADIAEHIYQIKRGSDGKNPETRH